MIKSLLRKKGTTETHQTPSPSPVQNARQRPTIETPLYARFASVNSGLPPQERVIPVVSGPIPLGRLNLTNLETEENRRRHDETALLSHARQEMPPATWSASGFLPHDVQLTADKPHQPARVILPIKAHLASFSDEQLVASKPYHVTPVENVHHSRDALPSPPISPRPSLNSPTPTNVHQSPSSSFPSVVKSITMVAKSPAAASRSYVEPRQSIARSSENLSPTSGSSFVKSDLSEPKLYKLNDNFSATGFPRSPNQVFHEPRQTLSAFADQGAGLTPPSNGHMGVAIAVKPLPGPPPDDQDGPALQTFRTSARDPPSQIGVSPSPRDGVHGNLSQTLVAESTQTPFATPPQSPDKRSVTPAARRAGAQTRGRALVFAAKDPESELAPEKLRRGPHIEDQEMDSRTTLREGQSPDEFEQRVQQVQALVPPKPLRSRIAVGSPEHSPRLAQHHSLLHSRSHRQEQTPISQAVASYDDEAPPTAHPAIRRISRRVTPSAHPPQLFLEEHKPPPAKDSRKPSHGKHLPKSPSPPPAPRSVPNPTSTPDDMQTLLRTELGASMPLSSPSRPLGRVMSSESSVPPTPPKKPRYDVRSEWSHHMGPQFSPQRTVPMDDIEIVTRGDVRKSWAVPVPPGAESEVDDPSPSSGEDAQEAVSGTYLPNGSATLHDGPQKSSVDLMEIHANGVIDSVTPHDPRDPQNIIQPPSGVDDEPLASNSSQVDVVRSRRRTFPTSHEEYSRARERRRGTWLEKTVPIDIAELAEETKPKFYPLLRHLQNPELLTELLAHLSFYEWLVLWGATSKEIRQALDSDPAVCDVALDRYMGTVGYARWVWPTPEPIRITLAEMHAYMRGVSVPVYVYAQSASSVLSSPPSEENALLVRVMKKQTRAFNRVVVRLRAQAEADADYDAVIRGRPSTGQSQSQSLRQYNGPPPSWSAGAAQGQNGRHRSASRQSSRAPSPTNSAWSQGASSQPHLPLGNTSMPGGFRSPLFRLRRAPLLRVFVPSREGDWLSDSGVIECETELRKAGVLPLLRVGDVVWDTALGDEGNVGRLVWDGRYLIDLDYTYSQIGDVPPALPALAFSPSYFHRVIRVAGDRNPIAHLDIRFWGEEITTNLQLLQDRVRTETPQGAYHTVVRWVHRSSFTIRPPHGGAPMIMLPNRERRVVDPGWRGTVVVEAEGTNEGLADLRARCRGAYQPRAGDVASPPGERERMVWRILRERSRPGEIWIRAVNFKERLIP